MAPTGTIYLVPVPIDDQGFSTIPPDTISHVHHLNYFIAERAKTARMHLKMFAHPLPMAQIDVKELDKHGTDNLQELLQPVFEGHSIGIMSESGCPGIADPGSRIVAYAHQKGIKVVPLVGPSSILLALMASGLSGQSFAFHGYLPSKKNELRIALKNIEKQAQRLSQSQIFIETPYRNLSLFQEAIDCLDGHTKLSIHMGLTGPNAISKTLTVKAWQQQTIQYLEAKVPTVFVLG